MPRGRYKPTIPAEQRERRGLLGTKKADRPPGLPVRREEKHEWPGASQLQLRFDPKCITDEGDFLTITFFKGGREVAGKALRIGGAWSQWPKQLTVAADAMLLTFTHAAEGYHEGDLRVWGYSFTCVAAKRWSADRHDTPSLVQLQTSLVYIGAKCASLLVCAEPVIEEEKDNRHWLASRISWMSL